MTVDAYAFYGASWMRRVVAQNVPALTLQPRIFTNTESVDRVEISNTKMARLDQFVFEGLKDVGSIVLDRVDVGSIQSYAFSGIHFRRDGRRPTSGLGTRRPKNDEFDAESGRRHGGTARKRQRHVETGLLNISSCHVGVLSTDAFRDANLAYIVLSRTDVDRLEKHAFRAVTGLRSLRIVDCRLESTIGAERFSSLRGLRSLHLVRLANTRVVDSFAFRGTTGIDEILIHFRSGDVTLRTEAFAHVSDVGTLELRGSSGGSTDPESRTTSLAIDVGAFRNLVGVERMRIVNFRLPTLRRHSFSGLSRVGNLTIADCSVSDIQREAFGEMAGHVGAIGLLDLGVGNQLRCDCGTASGAAALRRELAQRFRDYRAVCRVENAANGRVGYVDVRQVAAATCSSGSTLRTVPLSVMLSVLLMLAVYR